MSPDLTAFVILLLIVAAGTITKLVTTGKLSHIDGAGAIVKPKKLSDGRVTDTFGDDAELNREP